MNKLCDNSFAAVIDIILVGIFLVNVILSRNDNLLMIIWKQRIYQVGRYAVFQLQMISFYCALCYELFLVDSLRHTFDESVFVPAPLI